MTRRSLLIVVLGCATTAVVASLLVGGALYVVMSPLPLLDGRRDFTTTLTRQTRSARPRS